MRYFNQLEISIKMFGNKVISKTYLGTKLLWQAVRSCFGSGQWKADKPWKGDEKWKSG